MASQPKNIISATAMPPQKVQPYPSGATSPMTAGLKLQQEQANNQMALIGKSGGSKRRRNKYWKGGAAPPVVLVPPVQAGTVDPKATQQNYTEITKLSQQQAGQAIYDNTKTPSQVAAVSAKQQALYSGKTGGSRKHKKGGYWPVWGCLSGGLKTSKKNRTKRSKKYRKNKSKRQYVK